MSRIVSDRAEKTDQVVVLPSALEDSKLAPPGTYRIFLVALLVSIFAFFAALVVAYWYRAVAMAPHWQHLELPPVLWISTVVIAASSATFEIARRVYGRGQWRLASRYLLATVTLGLAFLGCQLTAWKDLVRQGAYLRENPHGSFFYLFTGLHAAHLVGGLIMLFFVMYGRNKRRELVNATCYYWHFLGLLWLGLFEVLRNIS